MSLANRGHLDKINDDVEFMEHQVTAIRDLARRPSFMLLDDMGLGKSLQALAVAAIAFQMGHAKRILIVCPASLMGNWAQELEDHTSFSWEVLTGTPKQREKIIANFNSDILITGFESVMSHVKWTEPVLSKPNKVTGKQRVLEKSKPIGDNDLDALDFDILIVDEAHAVKNREAKRTQAIMRMPPRRSFLLTGSPVLNQVDDLWTLFNRVDPEGFPNYWTYRTRYLVFGGFKGKQIVGVKNEDELRGHLQRLSIRREFQEVFTQVKDPIITPVWVDLLDLQRKLYEEIDQDMQFTVPGDPNPVEVENALVKWLRLKQVCGTASAIEGYPDVSAKLDEAINRLETLFNNGEPVVIFTQFREVLAALEARMDKAGMMFRSIHGDVPKEDRVPLVKEWTAMCEVEPSAMACMYQVGGVGLNMTRARKVIRIDRLWVPMLNDQAVSRVLRIGADFTEPVQVFDFIARHTVEQKVETINRRKRKSWGSVNPSDNAWKRDLVIAMTQPEPATGGKYAADLIPPGA